MPALPKHSSILYISSDQSYFAELDIEKKAELTNVTQVSFPLIQDKQLLQENVAQVLSKLEQKSYHLIVDDALFLHYIADFPVKASDPLEVQISNTVNTAFPEQDEPLHIVTIDLAKTTRIQTIQITAMTKRNLEILSQAASIAGVTIKSLIPASFVVKAFVSIDPSLFILHTTNQLLLTSHYIGVEYAENLENATAVTKALQKLKTTHPHLQHAYLCADEQVREELEKTFTEIIPTQTVKVPKVVAEDDTPYFFKALCIGYKEVIENKFPYPIFELPKPEANVQATSETSAVSELPELTPPVVVLKDEEVEEIEDLEDEVGEIDEDLVENEKASLSETPVVEAPTRPNFASLFVRPQAEIKTVEKTVSLEENSIAVEKVTEKSKDPKHPIEKTANIVTTTEQVLTNKTTVSRKKNTLFPYIFLTFLVAGLISLIGGGVVLSQQALTQRDGIQSPIVEDTETPEETPEPTPTPTPPPEPIAKDELSILIVNATGVAGQAGKLAQTFKAAGYTVVQTGNATGEYDKAGTFLMVKDDTKADQVLTQLKDDVKLELEEIKYDTSEDAKGTHDVIVVLNE